MDSDAEDVREPQLVAHIVIISSLGVFSLLQREACEGFIHRLKQSPPPQSFLCLFEFCSLRPPKRSLALWKSAHLALCLSPAIVTDLCDVTKSTFFSRAKQAKFSHTGEAPFCPIWDL